MPGTQDDLGRFLGISGTKKKPPTTGIGSYWERCWLRITLYRISSIDRVRTDRRTVVPCSHVATSFGEHLVRP